MIEELEELLVEHRAFVASPPIPNAVSNAYFVGLLRRLAETLDEAAARGVLVNDTSGLAFRVVEALGAAVFVAEMSFEIGRGSERPATGVVARRFPISAEPIDHGCAGEG